MSMVEKWDWQTGEKRLADYAALKEASSETFEPVVSPDGERFAVPVITEEDEWTLNVNGDLWSERFDRLWYPRFSPDGRLTVLVQADDMWTLAVDDARWDGEYDYIWNTQFSPDGKHIGVQVKREGRFYSLLVDAVPWESNFISLREFTIDDQGHAAAPVQVTALKEADVPGFFAGNWSLAVDDKTWEQKFVNVYRPVINASGEAVAAEVRTGIRNYTIAVNGTVWPKEFDCIWEPVYLSSGQLIAPVKVEGGWTLAMDCALHWKRRYVQLWKPTIAPDGQTIAAICAPKFGLWTIVVNDQPWSQTFSDAALDPQFSSDSKHVAAVVKHQNSYTIAVDGKAWPEWFDMAWNPVLSRDGSVVAAKVEKNGVFTYCVNGTTWKQTFEKVWDPVVSDDGSKLIIKVLDNGTYCRRVISRTDIAR